MLLPKLFVKNYKDTESPAVRTAYGKLSGIVGIICNLFLFAGKFTVGFLAGSVSVQADAINNLSDAASSLVGFLGFRMASRPADADHPYGHARYEYLSGLIVSVLIIVIGVELLKSSIGKIISPEAVEFSWLTVGVLIASIAIKVWLSVFYRRMGKAISSGTLFASSADSRNDVVATSAVLIAMLVSHYTSVELDAWMGVAVALFILYSGAGIVKDTLDPLLGKAPSAEEVRHIHDKIMGYPGVLGTHDLMVHDYGPGRRFASAHVEMSAEADPLDSHDVLDTIERDFLKNDGLHLVLHYDPISVDDSVGEMRRWLSDLVRSIDPDLAIHDLRIVKGKTHTNLIFDCVHSAENKLTEAEIRKRVREEVWKTYPNYYCVITVESGYVSAK